MFIEFPAPRFFLVTRKPDNKDDNTMVVVFTAPRLLCGLPQMHDDGVTLLFSRPRHHAFFVVYHKLLCGIHVGSGPRLLVEHDDCGFAAVRRPSYSAFSN